jgi:hypothetical protein
MFVLVNQAKANLLANRRFDTPDIEGVCFENFQATAKPSIHIGACFIHPAPVHGRYDR